MVRLLGARDPLCADRDQLSTSIHQATGRFREAQVKTGLEAHRQIIHYEGLRCLGRVPCLQPRALFARVSVVQVHLAVARDNTGTRQNGHGGVERLR